MNFFASEVVTPPAHLPITASDTALAAAVTLKKSNGQFFFELLSFKRGES